MKPNMLAQKYADLGSAADKWLIGHREKVNSVTFSSDGHYLGSASMDRSVRIWDVQTMSSGRDLSTSIELKEHEASVEAMTWDPTGPKRLASASSDRTV